MPDDDTHAKLNELNAEPADRDTSQSVGTTEHADIEHRLEADTLDSAVSSVPEPNVAQTNEAVAPSQVAEPELAVTPPQPALIPTAQPAQQASVATDELPKAGPGLLVLQWLVYAFWGWTVLVLSGLVALTINQLLDKQSGEYGVSYWSGGVAYLLAAVIVLFVIALACDIFYASAEKKHAKSGGTNVIMIIHAVLFALCGIGALITSVFGLVSLLLADSSDTSGSIASVISGIVIFVIYGATLLRTLRPRWLSKAAVLYWVFMTIVIVASVVAGIVGPAAMARQQNQDAAVESGLPDLAQAINQYTSENSKLPDDLSDLDTLEDYDYTADAKKLVDENKVQYKPGNRLLSVQTLGIGSDSSDSQLGGASSAIYHYELCVTYKANDESDYSRRPYLADGQKYPTSVETYGHKAGDVCYDVQTDYNY